MTLGNSSCVNWKVGNPIILIFSILFAQIPRLPWNEWEIYEFTIVQILLWCISYKTMVCNRNTLSRIFRLNLLQMRILLLYWYIMTMQFNLDLIFQYVALFMACDLIYYANLSLLSILIVLPHPDWNYTADISFIYFS